MSEYKCVYCCAITSTAGDEVIRRCGYCNAERPAVRDAARNRIPLDGSDAQALEGALQQAERELAELRGRCEHLATERDMVKGQFDRACEDIGDLRARCERAEGERDAAIAEANRRDQKWREGINSIVGQELNYDSPFSAIGDNRHTLESYIDMLRARAEKAVEEEQCRWQDRFNWIHLKYGVDGSGCDSGDPLDLTDTEVHALAVLLENERYDHAATRQRLTEAEKDAFLWRSVAGHFSIEAGLTEVTYYCRGTGQVVCRTSNMDVVNSASDRNRLAEAEGLLRYIKGYTCPDGWSVEPLSRVNELHHALAVDIPVAIDAFLANRPGEPAGGQQNEREGVTVERDPVASTCTWLG